MKNFLSQLFGKNEENIDQLDPKPATKEPPTIPLTVETSNKNHIETTEDMSKDYLPQYTPGCAQSIGLQRSHNEDSMFTFTSNLANNGNFLAFGVYIVADGMGGHKHGEFASSLAVKTLAQHIVNQVFDPYLNHQPQSPEESIQEILQSGVQKAHQAITKLAAGGGTTLTVALVIDQQMTVTHIGDSRCYIITPDGVMHLVTRDHSLVMRMIELGQLTSEEAAVHPQRNVLYRALGQNEPLTADIQTHQLPAGGLILVCSDGLWGVVPESKIIDIISDAVNPQQACERLVSAANQAGGPDNITAILVKIPDRLEA